ncbi:MAG: hypothetical protein ACLFQ4_02610 [Halanaerobium sp.]
MQKADAEGEINLVEAFKKAGDAKWLLKNRYSEHWSDKKELDFNANIKGTIIIKERLSKEE